jgi:predicted alpha/beta superfamily hydrolase
LNEDREIRIHLPSDYHTSSKKYPSLYVLDGENSDRLNTAISAITYLSRVRKLPQMIVIGVFNTDRTRDMTPGKIEQRKRSGEGDAFLEFVVSELHPHVDSRYRTAPCRVLFGGSSAGTFTLYALFSEPESFTGYVASRPVLNSLVDYTWDAKVFSTSITEKRRMPCMIQGRSANSPISSNRALLETSVGKYEPWPRVDIGQPKA